MFLENTMISLEQLASYSYISNFISLCSSWDTTNEAIRYCIV